MFGANPIRSVETDPLTLAVQEVFYTLQGEGPFAGHPATFIRLAGCNLACTFCDTEFETRISNRVTPDTVVESMLKACSEFALNRADALELVVLTGGEPLRQNVIPLLEALYKAGVRHVQVETAGTLWIPGLAPFINAGELSLVCSPKTPRIHPMVFKHCQHYKYIIADGGTSPADGLPVQGTQRSTEKRFDMPVFRPWDVSDAQFLKPTIWVSPCDAHEAAQTAANTQHAVAVALRHSYRLSLQMHKLVGLP